MIAQIPLHYYFPDGCILTPPPGKSHAFGPLESTFEGATCYILFSIGFLQGRTTELTAWYQQLAGGDLERVRPVYDGAEWQADMNS